ncbi:hypothetical protein [Parabacteroides sp. FAFU027]|uniref:hypothetical protein n=1 Tax=Parabacteroides sp. FAFU027 TaxID=2922715 RepID=UPI001FAED801|nr:hypothetical protein [Parabacteroides sp. FAFU027]
MKTQKRISILLQTALLLTFLLPFFPQGCVEKKAEPASNIPADSTGVALQVDKLADHIIDKVSDANTDSAMIVTQSYTSDHDSTLTEKLSAKSKVLNILLRPKGKYTGIGYLIEMSFYWQLGVSLAIAYILWIISLIIKCKDYNNIFHLINIIALIMFSISKNGFNIVNETRLWGFWVCFALGLTMTIYDTVVLLRLKKKGE